jgi:UDP-GlcNAc:undecaprenyl-phosphate GlcNAc-1-phosphate transferase
MIIILIGVLAFCISNVSMPILVVLSRRMGAISETGGRNVGETPVGRLGGVGILCGTLVAIVFSCFLSSTVGRGFLDNFEQVVGLLIGLIMVATIGFWDDLKRLRAVVKLFVQLLSAIVSYYFGLRILRVDLPLIGLIEFGWLSFPITILWIVGIVNAINLIDGLDGLAGGVLFLASIVNLVAAVIHGSTVSAVFLVSMSGALLGFLLYNWHPAKIFMGDGGAYSLGYLLSNSVVLTQASNATSGVGICVPLLSLCIPIIDILLTVLRRLFNGKSVFSPDRGHLHHILFDSGISHRMVVLGFYSVCSVFGSISLMFLLGNEWQHGLILLMVSAISCFIWFWFVRSKLGRAFSQLIILNESILKSK